jgi:hypothetical protein
MRTSFTHELLQCFDFALQKSGVMRAHVMPIKEHTGMTYRGSGGMAPIFLILYHFNHSERNAFIALNSRFGKP